jgi:nitroimidazol reductase NimA-like FMN-containing flavoprotein (pyridoxamine 5'-phosphate oxidase superfamily)
LQSLNRPCRWHSLAFSIVFTLGTLVPIQIDKVLKQGLPGRIGCSAEGKTYVVPTSYAYDGNFIYCHTHEGLKTKIRENPNICFEMEEMKDTANWKTVIVQGEFVELHNPAEINQAMETLLKRYLPMISSVTTHLSEHWPFHPEDATEIDGITFKIKIKEKYGRFESGESPSNTFG